MLFRSCVWWSITGASASAALALEWDTYGLTLSGYDVIDACDAPPYALAPGISYTNALYLGTLTSNSVLVSVRDNTGAKIAGATVTLSRSGYNATVTTSVCGTAYFGAISSSSSYTVQISKSGYTTTSSTNVNLAGHLFYATSFP